MLTTLLAEEIEAQIVEHSRQVDYDVKEYPVEIIVEKFKGVDDVEGAEFFVPEYQREHTWDDKRQSKFIESVLIQLPIPYLFLADINDEKGRLEIVDGSQRIRTLHAFLNDDLRLCELDKLDKLNGYYFKDLPLARQRKFKRTTLRMIVLSEKADEETRRDLFERINTGSDPLNHMEQRRGIMRGTFTNFLEVCAKDRLFSELTPLSKPSIKRREREEFVLRFFAYLNDYEEFKHSVKGFLDDYLEKMNQEEFDEVSMKTEFDSAMQFAKKYYPYGFNKPDLGRTPRIRFEALSVGAAIALRENPNLIPQNVEDWIYSNEFQLLIASDASNSKPKVVSRLHYVRDNLLGVYRGKS